MDDEVKTQLFGKLDRMSDDIVEIKMTLSKQEENIAHHIYRTSIAESRIEKLKEELDPIKIEMAKNQGIKDMFMFIAKISSVLLALGIAIAKSFSHFSK